MAVIGTEAFTIGGEPGADDLVFGAGEEYVTVFGVSVVSESEEPMREEGGFVGGAEAHLI